MQGLSRGLFVAGRDVKKCANPLRTEHDTPAISIRLHQKIDTRFGEHLFDPERVPQPFCDVDQTQLLFAEMLWFAAHGS